MPTASKRGSLVLKRFLMRKSITSIA